MTKRDLFIRLSLDEAGQRQFEGRGAFVLPATVDEAATAGTDLLLTHHNLAALATAIETVLSHIDTVPAAKDVTDALTGWRDTVEDLHGRIGRAAAFFGRGAFIGGDSGPKEATANERSTRSMTLDEMRQDAAERLREHLESGGFGPSEATKTKGSGRGLSDEARQVLEENRLHAVRGLRKHLGMEENE
jgi:hypothetical protein